MIRLDFNLNLVSLSLEEGRHELEEYDTKNTEKTAQNGANFLFFVVNIESIYL